MARGEASTAAATSEVGANWDQSSSSSTDNSSGGSNPYSEAAGSRHPVSSGGECDGRRFDPNHSLPNLSGPDGVAADRKSSLAFVVDFGGENSCGLRFADELSKYLPKHVQDRVRLRESTIRNKPTSKKDPAREGLQSKRSLPRLREQQRRTKCDPKIRLGIRKSSPAVYLPTIPLQNCIAPKASRTKIESPGSTNHQSHQAVELPNKLGGSQSYTIINASGEEVWTRANAGSASRIDEEDESEESFEGQDTASSVLAITEPSVCTVKTGWKQVLQGSNAGYKNLIHCQRLATGGWYRKQDLTAKPLETEILKAALKSIPAVTRYEVATNNNARPLVDRSRHTEDNNNNKGTARQARSSRQGSKYGAPSISQPLVDRCQAIGNDCRTTGRVSSCPVVTNHPPPPNTRTNRTFLLRCARLEAARNSNSLLGASNHPQGAKGFDACSSATAGSSFTSVSSRDSASMARGFLQHGATSDRLHLDLLRHRVRHRIRSVRPGLVPTPPSGSRSTCRLVSEA